MAYTHGNRGAAAGHTFGESTVSIVRVGMSENDKYASGYDAIFGGKKKAAPAEPKKDAPKKPAKKAAKKK